MVDGGRRAKGRTHDSAESSRAQNHLLCWGALCPGSTRGAATKPQGILSPASSSKLRASRKGGRMTPDVQRGCARSLPFVHGSTAPRHSTQRALEGTTRAGTPVTPGSAAEVLQCALHSLPAAASLPLPHALRCCPLRLSRHSALRAQLRPTPAEFLGGSSPKDLSAESQAGGEGLGSEAGGGPGCRLCCCPSWTLLLDSRRPPPSPVPESSPRTWPVLL